MGSEDRYDTVVIGSGPGGGSRSHRLSPTYVGILYGGDKVVLSIAESREETACRLNNKLEDLMKRCSYLGQKFSENGATHQASIPRLNTESGSVASRFVLPRPQDQHSYCKRQETLAGGQSYKTNPHYQS